MYLLNSVGTTITDWLVDIGIPSWIVVVMISMLPIVELRGALPAAILLFDMPWWKALLISILGNMIPIPFLLLLFPRVEKFLRRFKIFDRYFDWLFAKTRRQAGKNVTRFREVALIIFVAIPLPITGAWTGSLVAYLYNLNKGISFICIFVGVIIAGFLVLALVSLGISETLGIWGVVYAVELIIMLIALNRLFMKLQ